MAEAEAPHVFLVHFRAPWVCRVPGTPEVPSGQYRRPRALTAKTWPCCLLAVWESRAPRAPLANGEHGNRASEAVRSQYARARAADTAGEPAPSSPCSRSWTLRPPAASTCTPLVSPGHRSMPCPCAGHAAKRLAPLSPPAKGRSLSTQIQLLSFSGGATQVYTTNLLERPAGLKPPGSSVGPPAHYYSLVFPRCLVSPAHLPLPLPSPLPQLSMCPGIPVSGSASGNPHPRACVKCLTERRHLINQW